jgi:hypothetical protein
MVADLKAENDRLQELIKAGQKQPPVPAGEVTVAGKKISTVWGGSSRGYVDPKSGLPVSIRITKTDPKTGDQSTYDGGMNPALYDYYSKGGPGAGDTAAVDTGAATEGAATEGAATEEEQPDPAKLTRVSGTGTASRGPINMDFLLKTAPKFNSAEEVQAAVNDNPSLIGKIVYVGGVPMRVSGPE